ncbi:cytochrome c biogenesis factor [Bartonella japonica]|uniref:Cytochrome c biogenesis factor n=1 Tax=Bartonella japonica TaxID=357761 RepID=A0ABV2FLG8_9HYPH
MKRSNTLQTKVDNKISIVLTTLIVFLETQFAYAQEKVNSINLLIGVQYGLSVFIPIAGAIILLFLLLIYAFRIITKAIFLRWAFSVLIASAAFYISSILFHIT